VSDPEQRVGLPPPEDDGDADHLGGTPLPPLRLPASDGRERRLDELPTRSIVFVYPSIGGPGRDDLLAEWTAIPGARGCTPEACGFRDELAGFRAVEMELFGLSCQRSADQVEHARELELPYPLLSDESLQLREALGLPTFEFHGRRFYKRLTLIAAEGIVEGALHGSTDRNEPSRGSPSDSAVRHQRAAYSRAGSSASVTQAWRAL
jgi:peroxiredoxin